MEPIALERWFRSSRVNVNIKLLTPVSDRPSIKTNFRKQLLDRKVGIALKEGSAASRIQSLSSSSRKNEFFPTMMNRRAIDSCQRSVSDLIFCVLCEINRMYQKTLSSVGTDTPILMSSAACVRETAAQKKVLRLRQTRRVEQELACGFYGQLFRKPGSLAALDSYRAHDVMARLMSSLMVQLRGSCLIC